MELVRISGRSGSAATDDVLTALKLLKGEFLISAKDVAGEDLEDWRTARQAYFLHAAKAKLGLAIETARSSRRASVAAQLAEEGARIFPDEALYAEVMIESFSLLGRADKASLIWDEYQARAKAGLTTSLAIRRPETAKTETHSINRPRPLSGESKSLQR
jgi:hypothetical protein